MLIYFLPLQLNSTNDLQLICIKTFMVEQMLVFYCCAQNTYVYQLINNTL